MFDLALEVASFRLKHTWTDIAGLRLQCGEHEMHACCVNNCEQLPLKRSCMIIRIVRNFVDDVPFSASVHSTALIEQIHQLNIVHVSARTRRQQPVQRFADAEVRASAKTFREQCVALHEHTELVDRLLAQRAQALLQCAHPRDGGTTAIIWWMFRGEGGG